VNWHRGSPAIDVFQESVTAANADYLETHLLERTHQLFSL